MTMDWMDALRSHLLALPNLAKFAIVMAGIVGASALALRLRITGLVGLLAFGVLLGPHVLGVAGPQYPIAQFFADLGKLMLMFTVGLEINIHIFRQVQPRCIAFGLTTAMVPGVRFRNWPGVRLSDHSGRRYRFTARIAYPDQFADHHAP
jgi:predicted Kef-type K+ transport protein